MAATCRSLAAIGGVLPKLVDAYRSGDGVAIEAVEAIEAQGDFNRPWLVGSLATEYLPQVPDVHAKLQAGARVADIACGVGWAAISIARGYPAATVDGFDLDAPSIERAEVNARDAGVADRVTFEARDAADPKLDGQYDLAVIVEAVHDMSHPVEVLATVRRLLAPGGTLIVADERVADAFHAPAERDGAPLLRVQRAGLPPGRDGGPAVGGDGNRHAALDAGALRVGGGVLTGLGAADRARLPSVLPARPIAPRGSARFLDQLDQDAAEALGVHERDRRPARAGPRRLVHQRHPGRAQRVERCGDVVHAVRRRGGRPRRAWPGTVPPECRVPAARPAGCRSRRPGTAPPRPPGPRPGGGTSALLPGTRRTSRGGFEVGDGDADVVDRGGGDGEAGRRPDDLAGSSAGLIPGRAGVACRTTARAAGD